LQDTVALITGGAGHIGGETAQRLAAQGCHVVIVDKNEEAAAKLCESLAAEHNIKTLALSDDLLEEKTFETIAAKVEQAFGRLDFIVNNAAFYDDMPGWGVPYEQEGYEAWLKVMQVNLLAPFFLVQKLTPLLKKSDHASIVNVSSIYGVTAPDHSLYEGLDMSNPAAYAASKGGLIQLTKWLSTVLAPDIRVNAVTPGGVARGQNETFVKRYESKTPLARMATENDVARAILFLLSSDASYITGQNIIVDGGWTVW